MQKFSYQKSYRFGYDNFDAVLRIVILYLEFLAYELQKVDADFAMDRLYIF